MKMPPYSAPYAPKKSISALLAIFLFLLQISEAKTGSAVKNCWINRERELRYSPLKDALYCLPCFVTSAKRLHEANFTDVQFITKGFSNWPDIHARFGSHSNATQKRNTILHSHNVQNLIDLENKWAGKQSVHEQANQKHGTRVQGITSTFSPGSSICC